MSGIFRNELTPLIGAIMNRIVTVDQEAGNVAYKLCACHFSVDTGGPPPTITFTNITGIDSIAYVALGRYRVNFQDNYAATNNLVTIVVPSTTSTVIAATGSAPYVMVYSKAVGSFEFAVTYNNAATHIYWPDTTIDRDLSFYVLTFGEVAAGLWVDDTTDLDDRMLNQMLAASNYDQQSMRMCGAVGELRGGAPVLHNLCGVTGLAHAATKYTFTLTNAYSDYAMWLMTPQIILGLLPRCEFTVTESVGAGLTTAVTMITDWNNALVDTDRHINLLVYGHGGIVAPV